MLPVYPATRAVLLQFNTALSVASILNRRVITFFALITRKGDDLPRVASLGHWHIFLTGAKLPEILERPNCCRLSAAHRDYLKNPLSRWERVGVREKPMPAPAPVNVH